MVYLATAFAYHDRDKVYLATALAYRGCDLSDLHAETSEMNKRGRKGAGSYHLRRLRWLSKRRRLLLLLPSWHARGWKRLGRRVGLLLRPF
jgi:hypothetical protein